MAKLDDFIVSSVSLTIREDHCDLLQSLNFLQYVTGGIIKYHTSEDIIARLALLVLKLRKEKWKRFVAANHQHYVMQEIVFQLAVRPHNKHVKMNNRCSIL